MKRILLSAAALLATSFLVAACDDDDPTDPDVTTFSVSFSEAAEIYSPACQTPAAVGSGSATVTINADDDEITITDLNFTGLSGAVTSSHFHFGPVTEDSGPIVINIGAITSGFDGDFDSGDYAPQAGTPTAPATFALFIAAMKTGQAYINLHTTACPLGEIRGNLVNPT